MRWSTDREFDRLVRTRREEWLRLAIVLCGNRPDAEDALQDALVALGGAWATVQSRGANAYLRRILINKVIDRSRKRHELPTSTFSEVAAPDDLLRFEEDRQFFDTIARLPAVQRIALVCRFYLDLPDRETAVLLGCAEETVRSHIHRSIQALRRTGVSADLRSD